MSLTGRGFTGFAPWWPQVRARARARARVRVRVCRVCRARVCRVCRARGRARGRVRIRVSRGLANRLRAVVTAGRRRQRGDLRRVSCEVRATAR
jgi:hypothetical protein